MNRSILRRIEEGTARGNIEIVERILGLLGYELEMISMYSRSEHLRRAAEMESAEPRRWPDCPAHEDLR